MTGPERWRELLSDEQPEAWVNEMWHRSRERREQLSVAASPVRIPGRLAWGLALSAAALLLIGVYSAMPTAATGPLELAGDMLPGRLPADAVHVLSDGSEVSTREETHLDVLTNTGQSVDLALRRGRASFSIPPGGGRRWRVDCGDISVEVVGTVFHVARTQRTVVVKVDRGAVLVRGSTVPDGVQRLSVGEEMTLPLRDPEQVRQEAEAAAASVPAPEDASGAEGPEGEEGAAALGVPSQAPQAPRAPRGDRVGALLDRSDALRLSGRNERAAALLREVVARHRQDSRAKLAAYTLARLRLEALGQPALAARDFQTSLALGLRGPLAEAAHAGRVMALGRSGNRALAAERAAEYLATYPSGRYRQEVSLWR